MYFQSTPEMKGPMELRMLSIEPTFSIETGLLTPNRLRGATSSCKQVKISWFSFQNHHALYMLNLNLIIRDKLREQVGTPTLFLQMLPQRRLLSKAHRSAAAFDN